MVDCPQPIAANDDDFPVQSCDQIPHDKALAQGYQQIADPLDRQALATAGHAPNPRNTAGKRIERWCLRAATRGQAAR